MRELDECTAEVFRRSEKRIKERRRNRVRVLAVCIPVCLTAAVWSVMIFPGRAPGLETSDYAQSVWEAAGDAERDLVYIAVEIQDAGLSPEEHYGKVTDTAAVAEMFRAIQSLFADTDGNDRSSGENLLACESFPAADNAYYDEAEPTSIWRSCTITFTAEDGSRAVYHLSENTLVDVNTNETVFLSDAQIAELMAVLGISE